MQGLDPSGRVLYVGTFSKTLFPALRLGYLIAPPDLVDAFSAARSVVDRQSAGIEQAVLADFIADGHFARHVRRMRMLYEERRDALLHMAGEMVGDRLALAPAEAGMHVVARLPGDVEDRVVSAAARELGVDAPALSLYALEPLGHGGLVLGYAGFTPRALRQAMRRLATVVPR
jgi:GntR family transcriptional regulator/MocR family aminotransferase